MIFACVNELEEYERKLRNQELTLLDLRNYFVSKYSTREVQIQKQLKHFIDHYNDEKKSENVQSYPRLNLNPKALDGIYY